MATINKGQLFRTAVLAYMSEITESPLKKFCEKQVAEGGESVTFNRIKPSQAQDGVASMYNADPTDAGDMVAIKVNIEEISAQNKVSYADMKKTKIDVKNTYVRSLGNATSLKEIGKIIAKMAALSPKLAPTPYVKECKGVQVAGYSEKADVKKVITEIRKALALAKKTPDGHSGLALIISSDDWATLSTSDYVLSADYGAVFGGGTNGEPTTFYRAEVCIVDGDTNIGGENHTMYLMPSNSVCFAEWEGSMRVDAEFHPTDAMRWHLQTYKSVGAEVAEAHVITKISTAVVS